MKAIVWTNYGSPEVLQLQEVAKPVPQDNEILIRIHASTVTAGDCELRRFDIVNWLWLPLRLYMGILKPRIKILGQEFAGEVEAIGKSVTRFKKGDAVFAPTDSRFGAHAAYICLKESYPMALKPASLSYEDAATIPTGGLNALHFIRMAHIKPQQKVLINGAGGSIGTYAVQMAKSLGAEVTAVDSGRKLDMLRAIGADYVIDYTQEDFGKSGKTYDAIIDIIGKHSFSRCVKSLKHNGIYVMANPRLSGVVRGLWVSMTSRKKATVALAYYKTEDLIYLKELMEAGKIKAVIDKRYPLEEMAEAHRYVDKGYKAGNLVITIT